MRTKTFRWFAPILFISLLGFALGGCGGSSGGGGGGGGDTVPSAPQNVQLEAGDEQLTISWTPVDGATSYNIYWDISGGVTTSSNQIADEASPYPHTGLINYTTYYYIVTAVNAAGESVVSSEVSDAPKAPVPTAGLVAYYPFNGNANDESLNTNNGTVYGATLTTDRFGNANSAYSFDGANDYIALPDGVDLITRDFTISVWIRPNSYGIISSSSSSCGRAIFDYWYLGSIPTDNRNSGIIFNLRRDANCTGNSYLEGKFVDTNIQPNGTISLAPTNIDLFDWYLYTVVRSNTELFIYVNDFEHDRVAVSSLDVQENPNEYRITIGAMRRAITGQFFFPFDGIIDEVRIYERALSEPEIQAIYNEVN